MSAEQGQTWTDPAQCHMCGKYRESGERFGVMIADLDPGDPEVGPAPMLVPVQVCAECATEARESGVVVGTHGCDWCGVPMTDDEPGNLCSRECYLSSSGAERF
jgi:hypothetical protein